MENLAAQLEEKCEFDEMEVNRNGSVHAGVDNIFSLRERKASAMHTYHSRSIRLG